MSEQTTSQTNSQNQFLTGMGAGAVSGLLVGVLFSGSLCKAPVTKETAPAIAVSETGHSPASSQKIVKTWSGSGLKNTETFEITSSEWKLHWQAEAPMGTASLIINLHDSETPDVPVEMLANQLLDSPQSGDTIVRRSGKLFLKILGTTPWTVSIEE
ncbi:MAG TPA: hypothetical protein VNQ76_00525 [Planctomicrobium sp.]|nr:hypothetical protein [Planctomicrobium sp.]